jgi:hypothetical protein
VAVQRQSVHLGTKPLEDHGHNIFQLNTCFLEFLHNILSDERKELSFTFILRSESRRNHDHNLLSQIGDTPNLKGQAPVFISARDRGAQLYPQTLGSLSVAFYDSQGYNGGIRTRLHTGGQLMPV